MNNSNKTNYFEKDEDVKEMLETWDIVNCHYCYGEISMLDAVIVQIKGFEYFICKECAKK